MAQDTVAVAVNTMPGFITVSVRGARNAKVEEPRLQFNREETPDKPKLGGRLTVWGSASPKYVGRGRWRYCCGMLTGAMHDGLDPLVEKRAWLGPC